MVTVENILMTKGPDVIVAAPGDNVVDAAKMMAQANVGAVIIRDGDQIKGVFTERDLLHCIAVGKKDLAAIPLDQVMSSPVKSCRLADDVRQSAKVLQQGHIRHLAVIEDGALVGVIGLRDLLALRLDGQS